MSEQSARLSLGFSCVGHTIAHLMAPIFFVVALTLESEMNLSHGEVVSLIVIGNILYGVGAPIAGWIGDKWSAAGMMSLYYFGVGLGMIMTGFAATPTQLVLTLTFTGIFGSIYHPVGFAWLVSQVKKRGAALGLNGVFGTVGPSVAALSAGYLTDAYSWRAAFIVPGVLILAVGVVFFVLMKRDIIHDRPRADEVHHKAEKGEIVRTILVLAVTMLCTGLIYQTLSPALPKLFSVRFTELTGFDSTDGVFGVGMLVASVYIFAGGVQLMVGRMCDRYSLKKLYIIVYFFQALCLVAASQLGGAVLFIMMFLIISGNQAGLPIENSLVARYAPPNRRALVFGLKFILAFGFSGLGVLLEGKVYDATGGFYWIFVILGALAVVGFLGGWLLPNDKKVQVPAE
ncbi:MAG: MFS transporter [Rhodospirillaceae bacterium]|nr:MAG: MFS transporter [Rhodospirillaceae bacterium]